MAFANPFIDGRGDIIQTYATYDLLLERVSYSDTKMTIFHRLQTKEKDGQVAKPVLLNDPEVNKYIDIYYSHQIIDKSQPKKDLEKCEDTGY